MEKYNSKAVASLVLGIIGVAVTFLSGLAIVGLVCSIIALVFAIKIRKAAQLEGFEADGKATAGFVLGIVGIVVNVVAVFACIACAAVIGAAGVTGLESIISSGGTVDSESVDDIIKAIESLDV